MSIKLQGFVKGMRVIGINTYIGSNSSGQLFRVILNIFAFLTVKRSGLKLTCPVLLQDFSLILILPVLVKVDFKE
jgi:hypothetical protein